jgi:dihydrolipoamide dehydrogenase
MAASTSASPATTGQPRTGSFDRVLVAAGRRPNVTDIGLEALDLPRDDKGLLCFDPTTMQVGDTHVFIAGDVNNDRPLLHEAADEGRIAGANAAAWPDVMCHARRTPLAVLFSDPQIALVGASFNDMDCDNHRVGAVDYSRQGRARVMGANRGALRVYGKVGTGELLGAELLGPHMEHLAHLLAWAVQQRLTVDQALEMPFYHPVLEEGLRTALQDLQHQLRMARRPGDPCMEFGPGA